MNTHIFFVFVIWICECECVRARYKLRTQHIYLHSIYLFIIYDKFSIRKIIWIKIKFIEKKGRKAIKPICWNRIEISIEKKSIKFGCFFFLLFHICFSLCLFDGFIALCLHDLYMRCALVTYSNWFGLTAAAVVEFMYISIAWTDWVFVCWCGNMKVCLCATKWLCLTGSI